MKAGGALATLAALLPRPGERGLPALSGFLLALCYPPLHLLALPFVSLVPFVVFLVQLPPGQGGAAAAARGGFLLGLIHFGLVLYWMVFALSWFSWLAVPAYVASVVPLAGTIALVGWLLHRAAHRVRATLWLAVPVAWTAAEWLAAHVGDLSYSWLGLGTSLTGFPRLVGIAEWVGARGVTFWIALVNGLVAVTVLNLRAGRPWRRRAAVAALVVFAPMAWGVWRASTLEIRPVATVALVQPAVPQAVKRDSAVAVDRTRAALDSLMGGVAPGSADLVVWPEVVFPVVLPESPEIVAFAAHHALRSGAPILLGGYRQAASRRGGDLRHNSAFLVTGEGLRPYAYDKHFLVPGVERVPFVDPEWLGGYQSLGGLSPGVGWPLAMTGSARFGLLVCYESAFPAATRSFRQAGADVLVNITNDAWFGRAPWYARTTALWQHPAHLVMRAIETRTGVARAANGGMSMFIDPLGRRYGRTALFAPALAVDTVYTTDVLTGFVRFGDLVGVGSTLFALALIAAGRARGRWGSSLGRPRRSGAVRRPHGPVERT